MGRSAPYGFTLLEILIVGALIALFAGLAIFSAQQFYDDGKRRAMFDETKQVGTALAFAEHNLSFYPRLNLLNYPLALITGQSGNTTVVRPGMDMYGQIGENSSFTSNIVDQWTGAYLSTSEARVRLSQGNKGLVRMAFPEESIFSGVWQAKGINTQVDYWPSDVWGNPYTVYLVSADSSIANARNKLGLRLITRPNENPSYCVAVVSYGPNGVPGGVAREFFQTDSNTTAEKNQATAWINTMRYARLYLVNNSSGDPGTVNNTGIAADYTLRSYSATNSALSLLDNNFLTWFPDSLTNQANPGLRTSPGIFDAGADDIVWKF